MSPRLTILITTMSRRDLLERTLWHVYETSTDDERNIFVWDNASTDDTAAFLGTLIGWPGVRVFRSNRNVGAIESRNRMLAAVETPYVFTLDDDVWLLNRGWAAALSRVFDTDPSLGQVHIGPAYHESNDFGITHEKLSRPFFRVLPYYPGPPGSLVDIVVPSGTHIKPTAGEVLLVSDTGVDMPFAISGSASGWRVDDLRQFASFAKAASTAVDHQVGNTDGNSLADFRTTWGGGLRAAGKHEALLLGFGMIHPSPGPLWHLGRYEQYWETRCVLAQQYYGRSGDEQRTWLERARKASGWGQPLEDADVVLPAGARP